ncbi:MAG TPA: MerR family transcriptional regulator [Actinomycetales bacterium]|nr:MerR family transcriptional regulator [Actinomycetales bacterium]
MSADDPRPVEYTLTELAETCGMTERNVRAYSAKGLLPPPIRKGRRVVYGLEHFSRLQLVRALADHGLSLKVIGDLIDRGVADDRLARLARADLSARQTPAASLSLLRERVQRFEEQHPGTLDELEEVGLIERSDGQLRSNSTALGLMGSLTAKGATFVMCAEVGIAAARAALARAEHISDLIEASVERRRRAGHPADAGKEDEFRRLALQLATTAFHDALTRRVLGEGLADAPADGRRDVRAGERPDAPADGTTGVSAPRR